MNETEKTENEKSSYPQSSIREDLSSAESRSGSRDDEVHSGVDRANVKVKISQVARYVWQTLQAVREKQESCFKFRVEPRKLRLFLRRSFFISQEIPNQR